MVRLRSGGIAGDLQCGLFAPVVPSSQSGDLFSRVLCSLYIVFILCELAFERRMVSLLCSARSGRSCFGRLCRGFSGTLFEAGKTHCVRKRSGVIRSLVFADRISRRSYFWPRPWLPMGHLSHGVSLFFGHFFADRCVLQTLKGILEEKVVSLKNECFIKKLLTDGQENVKILKSNLLCDESIAYSMSRKAEYKIRKRRKS